MQTRLKNHNAIRKMTGIALLLSLAIVLQLISNYVQFGTFSITLALIPIVLAGILYGITGGTLVGLAVGIITTFAPSTLGGIFFVNKPVITVILCLVKMTLAGLLPALVFKLLKGKHFNIGVILASLLAPLVNTGIFTAGCYMFFLEELESLADGGSVATLVFLTLIGVNFLVEFAINAALSPALVYISKYALKNIDIGSDIIGKRRNVESLN